MYQQTDQLCSYIKHCQFRLPGLHSLCTVRDWCDKLQLDRKNTVSLRQVPLWTTSTNNECNTHISRRDITRESVPVAIAGYVLCVSRYLWIRLIRQLCQLCALCPFIYVYFA